MISNDVISTNADARDRTAITGIINDIKVLYYHMGNGRIHLRSHGGSVVVQ